jgi:hypothetical protein
MTLNLPTPTTNNSWAFVKPELRRVRLLSGLTSSRAEADGTMRKSDKEAGRNYSIRRALRLAGKDVSNYVISSCSREAKEFGIKAGMRYEKAKSLVPDLKVIVIGGRQI